MATRPLSTSIVSVSMFQMFRRVAERCTHRMVALATRVSIASVPTQLIVQRFRDAGAISVRTAQPYHPGSLVEQLEFQRLLRNSIIREPRPGRYYLDERTLSGDA